MSGFGTKIVNAYIAYDLDNCPKLLPRNFTLKNGLLGATNIAKNSDEIKWCIVAI